MSETQSKIVIIRWLAASGALQRVELSYIKKKTLTEHKTENCRLCQHFLREDGVFLGGKASPHPPPPQVNRTLSTVPLLPSSSLPLVDL